MGIKYLNQYLIKNCSSNSIKKIGLQDLKGKTIVIDTSIYIYKFLSKYEIRVKIFNQINNFYKYKYPKRNHIYLKKQ